MKKGLLIAHILVICIVQNASIYNALYAKPALNNQPTFTYIDFDQSMKTTEYQWIIDRDLNEKEIGFSGAKLMDFFKTLYNTHKNKVIYTHQWLHIPKIIHQIWIGGEVPHELRAFQQSWKTHHPDWEYRLWTQEDIPTMILHNRKLIEQAQNPAEIADLLRYEILYQYGGVYIDMDFECLQPLDELHYRYDLYVGLQPLDSGLVQLGFGLLGTIPGHPMLWQCLTGLNTNYETVGNKAGITVKSGPVYLTKIFVQTAATDGLRNIALPAHYFYPLGCMQRSCDPDVCRSQGSFGIHHWAKTWNKPECRRPQFRSIKSWGTLL